MKTDQRFKTSLKKLPAFPATIHKVTALINNPDSSLSELVDVVRLDQSITANILRMCNSAYFGLRHKVDNVHDAIMYLGRQNVVRAVMAAGVSRFFKDAPGYEAEAKELWEHAVGTALMSQILAKRITGREDTRLFTAALLHDIGKVILGEYVYELRDRFKNLMNGGSRSFLEVEEELLGLNHAEIGGTIAAAWNFPEDIQLAIAYHHRPDLSPNQESPVPWLIHLADQACLMLGIGRGTDGLAYYSLEDAIRRFNLSRTEYEEGLSRLVKELDSARELIGIVQTANK
jgi:putative nucleotidyltransferase with HDIG domain